MASSGLLSDKRAAVFGGGGSIGGAVAKEPAAEGAEVFVCGRNASPVELVVKQITEAGGRAHAHVIDVLHTAAVDEYLEDVVCRGEPRCCAQCDRAARA